MPNYDYWLDPEYWYPELTDEDAQESEGDYDF